MDDKYYKKTNGQYMTPPKMVNFILDSVGYSGPKILNNIIMEPSFGDGAFLNEIVKRIILESRNICLPDDIIIKNLKSCVHGIEKDSSLVDCAIKKINNTVSSFGIEPIDWSKNLLCGDATKLYKNYLGIFDCVVGNPPYVRVHSMDDTVREEAGEFRFSNGMMDLYVVFYEIGLLMLNNTGKLAYISPNSFIKNSSQQSFRNYIIDNKIMESFFDFDSYQIFKDISTYSCVCVMGGKNNFITYKKFNGYKEEECCKYQYSYMKENFYDNKWNLVPKNDITFLEKNKKKNNKISDIAIVQNGIATNYNKIFIRNMYVDAECKIQYYGRHTDKKRIVYFVDKNGNLRKTESTLLRKAIKASKYSGEKSNSYIFFPYIKKNEKAVCYTEDDFSKNFPLAYKYFIDFKDELLKRNIKNNDEWFLFARTQGILNSFSKNIVFKTIIKRKTKNIKAYIIDEDCVVYSGCFSTIIKKSGKNPSDLCEIYESEEFARYCSIVGKDMRNGYASISPEQISNFKFD